MSANERKRAQTSAKSANARAQTQERKRARKSAKELVKIANNQVWNNQVWELPIKVFHRHFFTAATAISTLPPGTKPIHAGNISWGTNFCANACGACMRTRATTEIFLRNHSPQNSQIPEATRLGANACHACMPTCTNTGKNDGELFMYWCRFAPGTAEMQVSIAQICRSGKVPLSTRQG